MIELKLNGNPISMELDTGAGISIVSKSTYYQLWPESKRPPLQTSTILLKTYTGEKFQELGVADVVAEYQQQSERIQLRIVDGNGLSLFK